MERCFHIQKSSHPGWNVARCFYPILQPSSQDQLPPPTKNRVTYMLPSSYSLSVIPSMHLEREQQQHQPRCTQGPTKKPCGTLGSLIAASTTCFEHTRCTDCGGSPSLPRRRKATTVMHTSEVSYISSFSYSCSHTEYAQKEQSNACHFYKRNIFSSSFFLA